MHSFQVETGDKEALIDITGRVEKALGETGLKSGVCFVFIPHTTAGLTINENADPSVRRDILYGLSSMVPSRGYTHSEGNSPAHIKASMMGFSVLVPVEGGRLKLGQWQGIYLCEFDGPRQRQVWVSSNVPGTEPVHPVPGTSLK
ncbi:MAG: secondary thiamine-phosphate synthase enzyme YjbQ [Candidatus Omnitrophica bacterium]|nr:secondary thiamine-phosphate synthase enzyme YjbQ [Candidatus Omnitrophota bacterium]